MTRPEPDQVTAEVQAEEPDFAGEHDKPTFADEQRGRPGIGEDESVPEDDGGPGGMDFDPETT